MFHASQRQLRHTGHCRTGDSRADRYLSITHSVPCCRTAAPLRAAHAMAMVRPSGLACCSSFLAIFSSSTPSSYFAVMRSRSALSGCGHGNGWNSRGHHRLPGRKLFSPPLHQSTTPGQPPSRQPVVRLPPRPVWTHHAQRAAAEGADALGPVEDARLLLVLLLPICGGRRAGSHMGPRLGWRCRRRL